VVKGTFDVQKDAKDESVPKDIRSILSTTADRAVSVPFPRVKACVGVWGVWGEGGCVGGGVVGCCRVGSLLTFDIPQTALVATLDTYDFIISFVVVT
jgi:hypothetical protein